MITKQNENIKNNEKSLVIIEVYIDYTILLKIYHFSVKGDFNGFFLACG